jgi:hypothetical protein
MIRPSDPNTEGMGGNTPFSSIVPKIQSITTFDDLPPEHQRDLEHFTEAVGDMINKRMRQKACKDADGIELYLACMVEQIAYVLMTQQSQNLYLVTVAQKLREAEAEIETLKKS